jgi:hypothetical protein
MESAFDEECLQFIKELSSEHGTDSFNREKEGIFAYNKTFVIYRQTSTGYDTMEVGMKLQITSPSVKDSCKAGLRPEEILILCKGEKGFACRTEKQVKQFHGVCANQGIKFGWQRENHMKVG